MSDLSNKTIAIATGNGRMNDHIEDKLLDESITVVHFREFLLKQEFDIIILSGSLKGDVSLSKLLYELKKKDKYIIFLTDITKSKEIDLCIKFGIHNILYENITVTKVLNLLDKPNHLSDISDLMESIKSVDEPSELEVEGSINSKSDKKGTSSWINLFGRKNKPAPTEGNRSNEVDEERIQEDKLIESKPELEIEKKDRSISIKDPNHLFEGYVNKKDHKPFKEGSRHRNQIEKIGREKLSFKEVHPHKIESHEPSIKIVTASQDEKAPKQDSSSSPLLIKEVLTKVIEKSKTEKSKTKKRFHLSGMSIAVSGLRRGVGLSHTALLIAYSLKELGIKRVAFVEGKEEGDLGDFFDYFGLHGRSPVLKGVTYFKDIEDFIPKINDFDVVIYDMGTFDLAHRKSHYKMANHKIIVAEGCPYKRRGLIKFTKLYTSILSTERYVLPLATKSQVRDFSKFMEVDKVYSLPSNRVFYEPKELTINEISDMLGR